MKPDDSVLLTDLYQLTMLEGYFQEGMTDTAVFEFFVRKLPGTRNFLLSAGLEQLLAYLESFHFSPEDCEWLANCGRFGREFVDYLAGLRFDGDVDAMPEGTIFFPDEPVVRVTAALPVAQLIETRLVNILQFQTLIASKAARCAIAAPGRNLVDFGLRRAHGAEAGLLAARASYVAGFSGTATVLAAPLFDIPIYGTMAHSYVMAHDQESDAFEHFAEVQPDNLVLLIDTYDTEAGAAKVVELARRLAPRGIRVKAVRLDSGDLGELAKRVRRILDDGGFPDIGIFASGDLDEYALQQLAADRAPIDGYGIGSRFITSEDAPYLNCAYKLEEYAGIARRKWSEGKKTWPGRKQVYRHSDEQGILRHDVLTLEADRRQGRPLLQPVMRHGRRLASPEPLSAVRERAAAELATLPATLRSLEPAQPYWVKVSEALQALAAEVDRRIDPRSGIASQ